MTVSAHIAQEYESEATASPLRVHRVAHQLTQQQLADRAGITRITVGALERGECEPRLGTAQALSEALGGVPVAELFPADPAPPDG